MLCDDCEENFDNHAILHKISDFTFSGSKTSVWCESCLNTCLPRPLDSCDSCMYHMVYMAVRREHATPLTNTVQNYYLPHLTLLCSCGFRTIGQLRSYRIHWTSWLFQPLRLAIQNVKKKVIAHKRIFIRWWQHE